MEDPTQQQQQHQYPGINVDLRQYAGAKNDDPCYPIGVCPKAPGALSELFQLREVFMLAVMDKLTDKPSWHTKVFDDAIVAKWRAEAMRQPEEDLYNLATEHVRPWARDKKIPKPRSTRILPEQAFYYDYIPKPRSRILSEQAFEYCIQELRLKAQHFQKTGLVPTLDAVGNCVVKSDVLVKQDLKDELVSAFAQLRADQAGNVDWHPRSNDMVQDLVHPSMYCLVWGKSHYIQEELVGTTDAVTQWAGQGKATPAHKEIPPGDSGSTMFYDYKPQDFWSAKYQWLPANLKFQEDGTARFTSYINNLHPVKYAGVYRTIEKLVDQAITAWDHCLSEHKYHREYSGKGRRHPRISPADKADDRETEGLWEQLDAEVLAKFDVQLPKDELWALIDEMDWTEEEEEDEEDEDLENDVHGIPKSKIDKLPQEAIDAKKWEKVRDAVFLEPDDFTRVDYACENLRDKFRASGLQVIVKMASIELTPENPEYFTGSWHIEGQMNEHICATALYYLDSENVTPSNLAFRMSTPEDQFELQNTTGQDAYNWLERVYGTSFGGGHGGACLQFYGSVETSEGRLLAFPNNFQHRVSSFRLQDPTKPGHRRFIALWLVDPHQRIVSTANVPPQQFDWWSETVSGGDDAKTSSSSSSSGSQIPPEVPDGLMSLEEAKAHRLKLMDERSRLDQEAQHSWNNTGYNFCEH